MWKRALTQLQNDAFLKHNIIFFIGTIVIAFLNYLYHPVLSRLLSVEQFGEVQTIFSLVFLSGVVLAVFNRMIIHLTVQARVDEGAEAGMKLAYDRKVSSLFTYALLIHVSFALVLALLSPALSRYFSFETSWSFAYFALFGVIAVPYTFYAAHLQGRNAFGALSIGQGINALGKLVFAVVFVLLGTGVFGAVGALTSAALVAILYMRHAASGHTFSLVPLRAAARIVQEELPYSVLVLLTLGLVTVLYSGDVLIVKRLFSPEVAGLYAGVATIARLIIFATTSISVVLISSVALHQTRAENRAVLKKGLLYVTLVGGLATLVMSLFPEIILRLAMGVRYEESAALLPLLSITMLVVSYLNLCLSYLLALRERALIAICSAGFVVLAFALFRFHATPEAIIFDFLAAAGVSLTLCTYTLRRSS